MDLDHFPRRNLFIREKVLDLLTLIALKLDDTSKLLVFHHASVTAEFLFEGLGKFAQIELFIETLNSRKTLPAVPLLEAYMDNALCDYLIITGCIRKGIKGCCNSTESDLGLAH